MAGFSSVTGLETVMSADNCCFDGTDRDSIITTNGELWIGSTASPKVRIGNITSPDGSIVIGYSSPDITLQVSATGSFDYVQIDNTDSPYTATADDYYIATDSTSGTITINLPDAPTQFRQFIIKDRTGQAAVNNVTVTTTGGVVTIDGSTTFVMNSNFAAIELLFNGTAYEVR